MRYCFGLVFALLFLVPPSVFCQLNQDMYLYVIRRVQIDGVPEFGFVSLTDIYHYSQHEDSTVLSDRYLGDILHSAENYHVVDKKHRERFLSRLNIAPSDNLYAYSLELDQTVSYPIADLELVAFLDFYGAYTPYEQADYMIGFALPTLDPWKEHFQNLYSTAFVFCGEEDPFATGETSRLVWKPIDPKMVPIVKPTGRMKEWADQYTPEDAFISVGAEFDFFARNYGNGGQYPMARQVIAVESSSGEVVYDQFFFDSEGSYLIPLRGLDDPRALSGDQWTGAMLKNKPPIITGFLGYSFGCVSLEFLDKDTPALWISCDNRH